MRKQIFNLKLSLTEARILFEIAQQPHATATQVKNLLGLDAGYLSRTLAQLERQGEIEQTKSATDGRERLLRLTPHGQTTVESINYKSDAQVETMLLQLTDEDRSAFLEAVRTLQHILTKSPRSPVSVTRQSVVTPEVKRLIREYYDAINVVVRDSAKALAALVSGPNAGLWIATVGDEPVGCVAMRDLPSIAGAAECKRLYVRPSARGYRIGDRLVAAMEEYALSIGIRTIYLDTHDGLLSAIKLYESRGYEQCERYNDNPQATIFMRKAIVASE
jgi:DNA-binding MarR family transcriptional regulator/GNAT superfamily N-acetyltransferase